MKAYLFLALLYVSPHISLAGDGHNHESAVEPAPRGGILRDAPPYKSELVLDKDTARIFVYDKTLKLVPKDKLSSTVNGQLAFPKDKKKREVVFELKGDNYEAKLPGIDKVHRYDLHVTLQVEGKSIMADFGIDNIH